MRAGDPMKAKHLDKALMQFAEEGAAKVFKPMIGSGFIVGVVGAAAVRRAGQPDRAGIRPARPARAVAVHLGPLGHGPRSSRSRRSSQANKGHIAHDHDGDIVYMTRLQWDIDRIERDHPELTLSATKEMMV